MTSSTHLLTLISLLSLLLISGCSDNAEADTDTQDQGTSIDILFRDAGYTQDTGGLIDQGTPAPTDQGDEDLGMPDEDLGVPNDMGIPPQDMESQDQGAPEDLGMPGSSFDDEFERDSLSDWTRRHVVEGEPPQYTLLDIHTTTPGAFTIEPTRTPGWYESGKAPLIFKLIDGNFSVETEVLTQGISTPAPSSDFNSAGLMARDPASLTTTENHIMVNVGRQNDSITQSMGTEVKTTINGSSRLELQAGTQNAKLILCRVGTLFHTFRQLPGEPGWTQITTFDHPQMPAVLQVGMVANAYAGADLRATFNYIRMTVPDSESGCTP